MADPIDGCPTMNGVPLTGREPLVAVEEISKSYRRRVAVGSVTVTLRAGEICGFVGANGGGKTTTLRMLAGILKPSGGRGFVLGFDLLHDAAKIRERVGYMSQRLSLYPELSVFENLRFRARLYALRSPRAAAESAIAEFGLAPWAHTAAGSLSGGWARRLQLAASLLHSPRLVLLDEPTAGLDAVARQEVWRRVEGLAATGAGVILCTHDLVEAERCSRAMFFADGQVLAAGTPAEIATRSPTVAFVLSGADARKVAHDAAAIGGVLTSYLIGESLRIVARPAAEKHLYRLAGLHGAILARTAARLEDAVLASSMPMGKHQ